MELVKTSSRYPNISWESAFLPIEHAQEDYNSTSNSTQIFDHMSIRSCYTSALKSANLSTPLNRNQLLEFLLRLAFDFGKLKNPISCIVRPHIEDFFKIYVEPVVKENAAVQERSIIFQSRKLNELLYDNIKGIKIIFTEACSNKYEGPESLSDPNKFDSVKAYFFFSLFSSHDAPVQEIRELSNSVSFSSSQSTRAKEQASIVQGDHRLHLTHKLIQNCLISSLMTI